MNSTITKSVAALAVASMAFLAFAQAGRARPPVAPTGRAACPHAAGSAAVPRPTQSAFFCKYCGFKASSIASLTASACIRHPNGPHKGKHALYEGSAKDAYFCKYCGHKSSTISSLTAAACIRHPNGPHKGKHAPAL